MAEGGKERRTARRIPVGTWVRIRRESGPIEVLVPVNLTRGGMSFESARKYDLHETVWVTLHYNPQMPAGDAMETRGLIVRAAPVPQWDAFSYSIKFL